MMYVKWIGFLFLSLIVSLIAMILAPILPAFATLQLGPSDNSNKIAVEPRLPSWLWFFQTPDNSLWGDYGWQHIHCVDKWNTYWGMVRWLWRNPAYGFEWNGPLKAKIDPEATVKFTGDVKVENGPVGKEGYCFTIVTNPSGQSYWHYCYVKRINVDRCIYINLGWKLKTYAEDPRRIKEEPIAMFVFSPRFAKFKVI